MNLRRFFANDKTVMIDIDSWWNYRTSNKVFDYGKQQATLNGVSDVMDEVRSNIEMYKQEMNTLYEQIRPIADRKYENWKQTNMVRVICKWTALVAFICYFLDSMLACFSIYIPLGNPSFLIFALALPIMLIMKFVTWIMRKSYHSYMDTQRMEVNRILDKFESRNNKLYKDIDYIYLGSLEPAHREAVLARRDQERHHQEMMEAQARHHQRVEEEQRKIRKSQEELLQIERTRENRYLENSRKW